MTCKNCKEKGHFLHSETCSKNKGKYFCTCGGLEVEMVEVGGIVDFEVMYGTQGHKTLYQCPNCKTIEIL